MDFDDYDFVPIKPVKTNLFNFADPKQDQQKKSEKKDKEIVNSGYPIKYNEKTMVYYTTLRKMGQDPIIMDNVDDDRAFKFSEIWDPYTGERNQIDPNGPLSFNPIYLTYFFYKNRSKHLWIPGSDEVTGIYSGYYGNSVGAGENCVIRSRGTFPDRYLFRLPIQDCYVTDDHNMQYITMGPKLTNAEIQKIDDLVAKYSKNEITRVMGKEIKLMDIKKLYDLAILNKLPCSNINTGASQDEKDAILFQINKKAIDALVKM